MASGRERTELQEAEGQESRSTASRGPSGRGSAGPGPPPTPARDSRPLAPGTEATPEVSWTAGLGAGLPTAFPSRSTFTSSAAGSCTKGSVSVTLFDPTAIYPTEGETGPREGKVAALRWQGSAGQAFPSSLETGKRGIGAGPRPRPLAGARSLPGLGLPPRPRLPCGALSLSHLAATQCPGDQRHLGRKGGPRAEGAPGRPAGLETQQGVHPGPGSGAGGAVPPPLPPLTRLLPAAPLPWPPSTAACATPGPGRARPPTNRQFLERLQWELPPPPARSPAACGGQTRSPGPHGTAPTSRKIAKRLKNK